MLNVIHIVCIRYIFWKWHLVHIPGINFEQDVYQVYEPDVHIPKIYLMYIIYLTFNTCIYNVGYIPCIYLVYNIYKCRSLVNRAFRAVVIALCLVPKAWVRSRPFHKACYMPSSWLSNEAVTFFFISVRAGARIAAKERTKRYVKSGRYMLHTIHMLL